ncbi:Uncharacterised protein [Legionella donaldsonii]|uniref:Uncharacterized protein n=1 Tax=Legionella donaldsonii TaxID=45060 RepID=A0A378J5X7_9GAMM|nr:Uncharacterised protein [Legionella donaldsonii]
MAILMSDDQYLEASMHLEVLQGNIQALIPCCIPIAIGN